MATYSKIGEFDPEADDWQQYVERLDFYFAANKITDAGQKRAIFLSACGGKTYAIQRDLCQPGKPGDISLTDLQMLLSSHFAPKRSIIVERFKFHSKVRQLGQSVVAYVAELRRLSEHCVFGSSLDDMLRDGLVCGINDEHIQRRLLSEPDEKLTLTSAIELATAMETAAKDVAELQQTGAEGPVHKLQLVASNQKPSAAGCFKCGGTHKPANCRFVDTVCHNCRKKGHLARKCHNARQPRQNRGNRRGATYMLEENDEVEHCTHWLYNLREDNRVEPYREQLSVNGQDITFEIDTGAGLTVLSEKTYRKMGGGKLHSEK